MAADKKVLNTILPDLMREAGRHERKASRGDKLYWIVHKKEKKAYGPYDGPSLAQLNIFRRNSLIAPYGSVNPSDWRRADEYPELLKWLEKKEREED